MVRLTSFPLRSSSICCSFGGAVCRRSAAEGETPHVWDLGAESLEDSLERCADRVLPCVSGDVSGVGISAASKGEGGLYGLLGDEVDVEFDIEGIIGPRKRK